MAFQSPNRLPSSNTPPPATLAAALRPDPAASFDLEARGPSAVDIATDQARVKLLRTMNAVRTIAPILAAAVAAGGNDRAQTTRFSTLLARSSSLAVAATTALGLDPLATKNRWVVNTLERGFAHVVAADSSATPSPNLATALVEALPSSAVDVPARVLMSEPTHIRLGVVQALLPVLAAQAEFDFGRNRIEDQEALSALVLKEVVATLTALSDPLAPAPERLTLFSLLCQESGAALAAAWRCEAGKAREAMAKKTSAEIAAWRRANPQGLPIDTVYTGFQQTMHRIRELAKQIPVP